MSRIGGSAHFRWRFSAAAREGFLLWLAYAAVEYLAGAVLEMAHERALVLPESHWRLNLLAFACYAVAGVVFGLAGNLCWLRSCAGSPGCIASLPETCGA